MAHPFGVGSVSRSARRESAFRAGSGGTRLSPKTGPRATRPTDQNLNRAAVLAADRLAAGGRRTLTPCRGRRALHALLIADPVEHVELSGGRHTRRSP